MLPVVATCRYLFLALLTLVCSVLLPTLKGASPCKVIAPPFDHNKLSTQVEIGTAMGKYVATKVIEIVAKDPPIELIHIFTHEGVLANKECDAGCSATAEGTIHLSSGPKQSTTTRSSLSLSTAPLA